ncbi:MAG: hypothetical protein ACE5II_00010 [Anaerolineae bacterium]
MALEEAIMFTGQTLDAEPFGLISPYGKHWLTLLDPEDPTAIKTAGLDTRISGAIGTLAVINGHFAGSELELVH